MRTTLLTLLLIQLSLLSYSQYCTSNGNTSYQTSTTRVVFNTIDNSTGKPAAYNDYTSISTTVTAGSSYNLTIQVNTDGNYQVHSMVWIDWNQNNDFTDVGEEYDLGTVTNVSDGATNNSPLSITVPTGATNGSTRMRVSTKYDVVATSCETGYDGEVEDYTVTITGGANPSASAPTFYNIAATSGYTYFDNTRASATPRFTISTSSGFDAINFEINTADDFTGTAYTQTITGLSGTANTHYDLLCDNLSPVLPTTNGAVYYVRARASSDGGSNWSNWSTQQWSFTHDVANYGWFQTAQKQFEEGILTGNFIYNTTNGTTSDYLYMNRGSFDVRTATDDGVKECGNWYPSANYMTIGYQNANCTGEIYNGTRFPSTPIPNGSNVLTATYYLDDNDGCPSYDAATVSVYVYGYDVDNAPTVSSSLDTYTSTTNTVNWDMSFTGSYDGVHTLSGVDNIIEEITSRPGWNENNALTLLVNGRAGEVDNGCVSQADNGVSTAPRLDGTFTNFPNYWLSPAIEFASFACSPNYQQLVWDADETYGSVKVQLYYDNGGTPTIIPDAALSGNSSGFTTSPINISGLNTSTYSKVYIRTILRYTSTNTNQTPKLNSWGIVTDPVASVNAGPDQSICSGSSVTLTASGCGAYEWSTGETTASITVSPTNTTTYTVTATVGDGNTETDQVQVIIAPLQAGSISSDQTICNNSTPSNLANTTSASNGIGTITYQWQKDPGCSGTWSDISGATNSTLDLSSENLTQNTCYRRVANDDCGVDKYSNTVTITVNPNNTISLSSAVGTDNQTVCINNAITNITYTTSGATGATFSGLPAGVSGNWNSNVVTINGTPTASGNFSYTINLTGGCGNVSANGTINVSPSPVIDSILTSDVTVCSPPYNGTFTVYPNGNQYSYDGGSFVSTNIVDTFGVGSHTVILKDINGCTVSSSASINSNTGLVIDSVVNAPILCYGDTTELIVYDVDAVQYSIDNGINFQTDSNFSVTSDIYNIIIVDAGGCQALINNYTITQPDTIVINTSSTDVSCTNPGTAMLIAIGGTGSLSYLWSNGDTTTSINNLTTGIYNVTVTDENGCFNQSSAQVNSGNLIGEPSAIINNVLCYGDSTASITVGLTQGNSPFTYSWQHTLIDTSTITSLPVGTYNVTITDAYGCTADTSITITQPDLLYINALIDNINCFGDNDGKINLLISGGITPYSINWGNGTINSIDSLTNLQAGTYNIIVTDNNACTTDTSVNITEPLQIEITNNITDVSCYGENTGAIVVSISNAIEPYSVNWSNNETSENIINLNSGMYYSTITDANNCTVIDTVVINQPDNIDIYGTINNVSCYDYSDGNINLQITGATAPYQFTWNNNELTQNISNVGIGTYIINIIDANNCNYTDTFVITQPEQLQVTSNIYYDNNLGNIELETSGGTPDYVYNWSNSQTSSSIINLQGGNYNVTVSDANNCADTLYFSIDEIDPIIIPSVITPNGDGVNDTWEIKNIENIKNVKINIFNRWGDEVYSINTTGTDYANKSVQWSGVFNEKELPLGTYVYILVADEDEFNGTVTIVR